MTILKSHREKLYFDGIKKDKQIRKYYVPKNYKKRCLKCAKWFVPLSASKKYCYDCKKSEVLKDDSRRVRYLQKVFGINET